MSGAFSPRRPPATRGSDSPGRDRAGARARPASSCAICPRPSNVVDFALRLTRATRPADPSAPPSIREWVKWGAGPRAGQALLLGAKASALMDGRSVPSPDDLRAVALPVLRHRLLVNFQAEADGVDPDQVIGRLLEAISPDVALSPAGRRGHRRSRAGCAAGRGRTAHRPAPQSAARVQRRVQPAPPYRAGDDLKYLDWKLLARTDRLYSRQFRETTNMAVMIALDASASMAFPEKGVSKWRYARPWPRRSRTSSAPRAMRSD